MVDYTLPLDELPDPLPIEPLTRPFDVTITPPGSKSITCRAYVLAALAEGESRIIRPLRAEDTDRLLDALCTLGAEARWEGEDVFITGVNGRFPRGGAVNLGDGGTPTRFMIACACLAAEPVVVDGSARMRERPIAEGVDMLRQLGARIEYVEEDGRLPVRVVPSEEFRGGELTIGKTASSQSVSAVMLTAPWLPNGITIHFGRDEPTSASYLKVTLEMVGEWGCAIDRPRRDRPMQNTVVRVPSTHLGSYEFHVEPDASSAVYSAAAALLTNDARCSVYRIEFNTLQADAITLEKLSERSAWYNGDPDEIGIVGPLSISSFNEDLSLSPDGAVLLVAVAAMADGISRFTGLHTLRVKETDRIAALANELRKVGCEVETTDDSITITPVAKAHRRDACATQDLGRRDAHAPKSSGGSESRTTGVTDELGGRDARPPHRSDRSESSGTGDHIDPVIIETYNDHRMAMAFAVLGLAAPGGHTLAIRNPVCVRKSYPTFWQDFAKLYASPRGD